MARAGPWAFQVCGSSPPSVCLVDLNVSSMDHLPEYWLATAAGAALRSVVKKNSSGRLPVGSRTITSTTNRWGQTWYQRTGRESSSRSTGLPRTSMVVRTHPRVVRRASCSGDGRRRPRLPRPAALPPLPAGRRQVQRGVAAHPRGDVGPRERHPGQGGVRAIAREGEVALREPGRELPQHRGPQLQVGRPALAVEPDIDGEPQRFAAPRWREADREDHHVEPHGIHDSPRGRPEGIAERCRPPRSCARPCGTACHRDPPAAPPSARAAARGARPACARARASSTRPARRKRW